MKARRKKQGKQKGKEFMDAVYEGYVRHVALRKWREVEAMLAEGLPAPEALKETGQFPERGRYRAIWEEAWRQRLRQVEPGPELLGLIEAAVSEAFEREVEERQRAGDRPLDEHPDFKRFVDGAFEQLFAEEAGTLEEID